MIECSNLIPCHYTQNYISARQLSWTWPNHTSWRLVWIMAQLERHWEHSDKRQQRVYINFFPSWSKQELKRKYNGICPFAYKMKGKSQSFFRQLKNQNKTERIFISFDGGRPAIISHSVRFHDAVRRDIQRSILYYYKLKQVLRIGTKSAHILISKT